jgi:hypothetical protein
MSLYLPYLHSGSSTKTPLVVQRADGSFASATTPACAWKCVPNYYWKWEINGAVSAGSSPCLYPRDWGNDVWYLVPQTEPDGVSMSPRPGDSCQLWETANTPGSMPPNLAYPTPNFASPGSPGIEFTYTYAQNREGSFVSVLTTTLTASIPCGPGLIVFKKTWNGRCVASDFCGGIELPFSEDDSFHGWPAPEKWLSVNGNVKLTSVPYPRFIGETPPHDALTTTSSMPQTATVVVSGVNSYGVYYIPNGTFACPLNVGNYGVGYLIPLWAYIPSPAEINVGVTWIPTQAQVTFQSPGGWGHINNFLIDPCGGSYSGTFNAPYTSPVNITLSFS